MPAPATSDEYGPDDQPNELSHVYFVPQDCGHVLEVRCKQPVPDKQFEPIVNHTCMWCEAAEAEFTDAPTEFRSAWKGGFLVRKSPFNLAELLMLAEIETEVMKDAAPATEQ